MNDSNMHRPLHGGHSLGDERAQTPRSDRLLGIADTAAACSEAPRTIRTSVNVHAESHFERALSACKDGCKITRAGWNAGGQHVEVQYPDKGSRMGAPYLVLKNAQGVLVPWVPSQGDLFARDWAVLPPSC